MSSSSAQLRFAAEFATFLVTVAGAAVVALRPGLIGTADRRRGVLVIGFLAVAGAAFLHGSLATGDDLEVVVVTLRSCGIVLLGLGSLTWGDDRATWRGLWAALVFLAAAEATSLAGAGDAAEWIRGAAAVALCAVLLTSARRSIPARVAASAAVSLLVVVLAVSVALSIVIGRTVRREAVRRVDTRAVAEAGEIGSVRGDAARRAQLVALTLEGGNGPLLLRLADQPVHDATIEGDLSNLRDVLGTKSPLLYVTNKRFVAAGIDVNPSQAVALAGSPAVTEVLRSGPSSSSVEVVGDTIYAVGVYRVQARSPRQTATVGAVVATVALDRGYLDTRSRVDQQVGLALVDRDGVRASFSTHSLPPDSELVALARTTLSGRDEASAVESGFFLVARPMLNADGTPVVAVVSATPTTVVDATRRSLFRTLFLVALLTALAGVVVALFVGERIGAGLRRLTGAAEAIQRGDLRTRTAITSRDEVGVLSETFDAMAASIESKDAELRQAAADEAAVRNRLEAVVAGMGDALVAVDGRGRITTFNQAAHDLLGVPVAQALGRPVTEVVRLTTEGGADLSDWLASPSMRARTQPSASVLRSDGEQVPVSVSAGGLRGAGDELVGGVFVLRDMRRELEVQRLKAEILANVSHELRTPLAPIKGYTEMLLSRPVPPEQSREFLEAIREGVDQLEWMVGLLVTTADLDAGRRPLRKERVPARQLVDTVVRRWQARAGEHHLVSSRVARNLPDLLVDRQLIEQSLDQIVHNAVKFSPDGGKVWVTASLAGDGRHPAVAIAVRDQGIGVADPERVFEDFWQEDSSTTRPFGGLGLGLPFVRRIVRAHGGEPRCESAPGKGSVFSIVLPTAESGGRSS